MPSSQPKKRPTVAVLGTGPAGLMAAQVAAAAGLAVTLVEKRKAPGRKLLIAGSSGLNITYDCPATEFARFYRGGPEGHFQALFEAFPPDAWREHIHGLGIRTFKGTSRRWFVEGMKAATLLKSWLESLSKLGCTMVYGRECTGFERTPEGVRLSFNEGPELTYDAVVFALGGGSYEPTENPLRWPAIFEKHGLELTPFRSSNAGFQVAWPAKLLEEAEGQPVKNAVLRSSRGERAGDLVITSYGLEGTPVYFAGETGVVHLDLKPDLTEPEVLRKLQQSKENLSPIRRVKKFLNLSDAAFALLFHLTPPATRENLSQLVRRIKAFPLTLGESQPLSEAISSSGGLRWDGVDARTLMLRDFPGVHVAGEMLDWDAPTGGFLIQASVSQGAFAGASVVKFLRR